MSSSSDDDYNDECASFDQNSLKGDIQKEVINKLINIDEAVDRHEQELMDMKSNIYNKFKNLTIVVDWEVPVMHNSLRFEKNFLLKKEISEKTKKLDVNHFTEEEDERLKANWNSFKEEYGFDDPKYFLPGFLPSRVFAKKEKRKFVQCLGRGIPQRTLRSIYDRFYEIYTEENGGLFNYVEDQIIIAVKSSKNAYFQKRSKSRFLQLLLGRKKIPLIRRYNSSMKCAQVGGVSAPVYWTKDLCTDVVSALMKKSKCDDLSQLEDSGYLDYFWEEIGNELGINASHLKFFWQCQLSPLLFAKECISRNQLRCFLIVWFITHQDIKNWSDISWWAIAEELSAPKVVCFRVFKNMVNTYVPEYSWDNVQECAQYLYTKYFHLFSTNKLKDRYLNRLVIEKEDFS